MTNPIQEDNQELFRTLALCKTEDEIAAFMKDLTTEVELRAMALRWKAAKLINSGITYNEISKQTGLSTTTITRVAHAIKFLTNYGYVNMLKKLGKAK